MWILKALLVACLLVLYIIFQLIGKLIFAFSSVWQIRWQLTFLKLTSRALLIVTNTQLIFKGKLPQNKPVFLVSNHLSYIDILVTSSVFPCIFLTSVEMQRTPFLGFMASLAGARFTERRNKFKLKNEINNISKLLSSSVSLAIYPEGTSTNGEKVLNFKSSFFESSVITKTPVQPVCINYTHLSGKKVTSQNRDKICWYGKASFAPHLIKFLKESSLVCELNFLPLISVDNIRNRLFLSEKARDSIVEVYKEIH